MTVKNKKICACSTCSKKGKEQTLDNFYATSSLCFEDGRIHICKTCCIKIFDSEGFKGFQSIMKLINKPILNDKFKGNYGDYIRQVNSLPNYKYQSYEDSDIFEETKMLQIEKEKDYKNKIEVNVDEDIIYYWGKGYEEDEYQFLENEKLKLESSFECPDYGMEMIMKDICFINLEIERVRQERTANNQKTLTNLIETRSKLMNDANMKPIQATGAEGNDQITFGTLIKKWENERPVPKPIDDEMKRYIDTYMVGHLAKMEGLNNELTQLYDEEIAKYTVSINDVKNHGDEYDE